MHGYHQQHILYREVAKSLINEDLNESFFLIQVAAKYVNIVGQYIRKQQVFTKIQGLLTGLCVLILVGVNPIKLKEQFT